MENTADKRLKCPDCCFCQGCSETRCRVCRGKGHEGGPWELGAGFSLGAYETWKRKRYGDTEAGG